MSEVALTAKIQLLPNPEESLLLLQTMAAYTNACNAVSEYIFGTHDLKQSSVNRQMYYHLRDAFGLRSQMAQSVIKTVIARYKSIVSNGHLWVLASFERLQYDLVWNRDYSLKEGRFSVNTLQGRIQLGFCKQGLEKYFDSSIYRFGTAKLVCKKEKFFLHISVLQEVADCEDFQICNVVGVDRGINFIIATYDSRGKSGFVSGRAIKDRRKHYAKLRKELQSCQTASARRRLKAIGQRENRWMSNVNHCISKALVESQPEGTLFVLEDLKGVRHATERVRIKDRYVSVSWAFDDLAQKIVYKVKLHHSKVIFVPPAYTSQTCPKCGHTEKMNRDKRNHVFCCRNCHYSSNDDRVAAMNLYRMGINYLSNICSEDADTHE